ncbi:hypothetical protein [Paraflavitalea pollutisoli]|uniref:hypothetical protein n=1 Tax=Paraflavitalea pollutisoli TaxID=3034143 RepID=UPI0023EAAD15|nr:hypothetical protein [Paraflavitalea sp. H1-2-19X]
MYNKLLLSLALFSAMGITGCQKDDVDPPPPVDNPPALQFLVKSMEFDIGTVAHVRYNPDSTIHDIFYNNQSAAGQLDFTWSGKQALALSYDGSLYRDTFVYVNGRLTSLTNGWKRGTSPTSYKLDYAYNSNGSLAELNYYQTNEAGTKLIYSTTYAYHSNGDLASITSTQKSNQYKIKLTIDSWSADCEINPWLFIGPGPNEWYTLYNYPLLSTFKKLPGKITKTVQQAGQAAETEQITVNTYTITNKRLDKTATALSYPKHPNLDQSHSVIYKY